MFALIIAFTMLDSTLGSAGKDPPQRYTGQGIYGMTWKAAPGPPAWTIPLDKPEAPAPYIGKPYGPPGSGMHTLPAHPGTPAPYRPPGTLAPYVPVPYGPPGTLHPQFGTPAPYVVVTYGPQILPAPPAPIPEKVKYINDIRSLKELMQRRESRKSIAGGSVFLEEKSWTRCLKLTKRFSIC